MAILDEKDFAHSGDRSCEIYRQGLEESADFRREYRTRIQVVKAADMPFENSPDGLLKHMIHEKMDTTECCLDIYMQFLPPGGKSGKARRLPEQIFYVLEGRGYDLHWDVKFEVGEKFEWDWEDEPKRYDWRRGDFVFIPAYTIQQHFNGDADNEARIIMVTNRIFKAMGLNWMEQIENAPTYDGDLETELAGPGWHPDTRA